MTVQNPRLAAQYGAGPVLVHHLANRSAPRRSASLAAHSDTYLSVLDLLRGRAHCCSDENNAINGCRSPPFWRSIKIPLHRSDIIVSVATLMPVK